MRRSELMRFGIIETLEAARDVLNLAGYMLEVFGDISAAKGFRNAYVERTMALTSFPKRYRGIGINYRGNEIRLCPFGTYHLFFAVNERERQVVILRVLKGRQNWWRILREETEYHFPSSLAEQ